LLDFARAATVRGMGPLAKAVFVVANALPAPYSTPDVAELRASERAQFLPKVAVALESAAEEATCTGRWAVSGCKRRWPGTASEAASMTLMQGWFESRLDHRIQAGDCRIWGPKTNQRECDGALYPLGAAPKWERGIRKDTRWGTVVFRSVTVFQLLGLPDEKRDAVVGLEQENVTAAAQQALSVLAGHRGMCRARDWVTCTISGYAGTMSYRYAPMRAAMFRKIHSRVLSEMKTDAVAAG